RLLASLTYAVRVDVVLVLSTCRFFFSSRRRHTRSKRDWSSDVCSSDLDVERVLRDVCPPFPAPVGPRSLVATRGLPHNTCTIPGPSVCSPVVNRPGPEPGEPCAGRSLPCRRVHRSAVARAGRLGKRERFA